MKKTLVLFALAFITACAFARDPQKGYRGFVDLEANVTSYNYGISGRETVWMSGTSTSHGYQFNPHLYVGGGLTIEGNNEYGRWLIPLFAQIRTDQHWGKFTPFGDFRIGYNIADGGGIYMSPTIGYRFNFGHKVNLNLGIGMTLRGYGVEQYEIIDLGYDWGTEYLGKRHESKANFTIRVGIDF